MKNEFPLDHFTPWLSYCFISGEFHWIVSPGGRVKVGGKAGTVRTDGYRQIRFKNRIYLEHRLAWLFHTGEWPINQIDHINGDRSFNPIENLREATTRENHQNMPNHRDGNLPGAVFVNRLHKWRSLININGRCTHLGFRDTEREAHEIYMEVATSANVTKTAREVRARLGIAAH